MTDQPTPYQLMLNKVEPHNGWTNKPTWAVALWLSNDEGMYRVARNCVIAAASDIDDYMDARARHRATGEALKDLVETHYVPHQSDASLEADLITWALAYVNWEEIAEAWSVFPS